jgi:hypothetical protein
MHLKGNEACRRRAAVIILFTAAIWSQAAVAQTKQAWRTEAQSYFQSCDGYRGSGTELCKLGQSQFMENYQDAYLGRLESWRNIAFFLTPSGDDVKKYGIRPNQQLACRWRMSVLFSASDDLWQTDNFRANDQCNMLTPADFATAVAQARSFVKGVHVVLEDDPKAPWNKDSPIVDKRCLDSRVQPLGAPDLPRFVPPPGCPRFQN